MNKRILFKNILLISFAVIFIIAAGIGEASAYFTTYASAKGGHTIELGYETTIQEGFDSWTKHVKIQNTEEDSQPIYVRARAYCGDNYKLDYFSESSEDGGSWVDGKDGWYYYTKPVAAGEDTSVLDVIIADIPEDSDEFNVVVVYESTPVIYDENGNPYPWDKVDWTATLDKGEWGKGGDD